MTVGRITLVMESHTVAQIQKVVWEAEGVCSEGGGQQYTNQKYLAQPPNKCSSADGPLPLPSLVPLELTYTFLSPSSILYTVV